MYLILRDIVKVFPPRGGSKEVLAVNHVSLNIEQGELVTLLGPSGCGKTTTLRMIAGSIWCRAATPARTEAGRLRTM